MSRRLAAALVVLALLGSSALAPQPAQADVLYSVSAPQSATAPTRTGWTALTFTGSSTAAADSGGAFLQLPADFDFPFYGHSYSALTVTVDGLILFDNDANALNANAPAGQKGCGWDYSQACANTLATRALPDAAAPNNFIAFWWSDMLFASASGHASWALTGSAPDRIFSLEYTDWRTWTSTTPKSSRTVTVELHETSGQIDLYYGSYTDTGDPNDWGASVGLEGPLDNGAADGLAGLSCTGRYSGAPGVTLPPFRCRLADWPSGQLISFAVAQGADLRIDSVALAAAGITPFTMPDGSAGFEANLTATVRNRGTVDAAGVDFDLFLTKDLAAPTQTSLGRYSITSSSSSGGGAVFTVPAQSTVQKTLTVQFARPAIAGKYYFTAIVDPTDAVAEVLETNNTFVPKPSESILIGADLVATSISTPVTSASFGQALPVSVVIHNGGTDPISAFTAEIWLSSSATTLVPAGGATSPLQTLSVTQPLLFGQDYVSPTLSVRASVGASLVNAGPFFLYLKVDPANAIPELSENNNVASSPAITLGYADLYCTPNDFKVTAATDPYPELTQLYFGDTIRVVFKAGNRGTSAVGFSNAVDLTTGGNLHPKNPITNHLLDCTSMTGQPGVLDDLTYGSNMPLTQFEALCTLPPNTAGLLPQSPDVEWLLGVYIDAMNDINELDEMPSSNECARKFSIRNPAMDLRVDRLEAPAFAAPGETVFVTRLLRNTGVVAGAFDYLYVLSPNDVISGLDPTLPVVVAGGAEQELAQATLAAGATDLARDLVAIPPETSPGTYYVGVIVDPYGKVAELDEYNNQMRSMGTLEVLPSSVRIETHALADAVVGAPYGQALVASGCDGLYAWDLYRGALPPGLALSSDGYLQGSATAAGTFDLVVRVRCGDGGAALTQSAIARFALRAIAPTTSLAILSTELPPATRGAPYAVDLVAIGGVPPYAWSLASGDALPAGLALDEASGRIKGTATGPAMSRVFGVVVTDAAQNRETAVLRLRVVEPSALRIVGARSNDVVKPDLPGGQVARHYPSSVFVAEGAVGATSWAIVEGQLPDGIELDGDALRGTPVVAGAFKFIVEARDEANNEDRAPFVIVVSPIPARFDPVTLSAVLQGESYYVELGDYAEKGARFTLYSGRLPGGLTLATGGRISGVVDSDATVGAYDFIVQVVETTGASTLAALTIRVNAKAKPPPAPPSSGCSTGTGPASVGSILVALSLLLPLIRRRREFAAARSGDVLRR